LKYLEGVSDRRVLARLLNVKTAEVVRSYEKRLRSKLLKLAPPGEQVFSSLDSIISRVCPECLDVTLVEDSETGERVCSRCGLVLDSDEPSRFDESLPFDTTYALESSLAVGKSLGGTLSRYGLYRVLAKSQSGAVDLGLRARYMRVFTETSEYPGLAKALRMGYELSKSFGLEENKVFNNVLGKNIRRAFWTVKELGLHVSRKELVETAFHLATAKDEKLLAAVNGHVLAVNSVLLNLMLKLDAFLAEIKGNSAL
jgi:hypothetical protein